MDMIVGESPMIEGTWFNPSTGHTFTAKDTYMEDNRMYVVTTDGQRIDYEMLSHYVKSDNPQRDMKEFARPKQAASVLPAEVQAAILPVEGAKADPNDDLMSEEDRALINGTASQPGLGNPVSQPGLGNIFHQHEDEDTLLVRRMLKRAESPKIDCDIVWNNFPTKQMDMLETMGVDFEKVADFFIKDLDIETIKKAIRDRIVKMIEDKLFPEPTEDKEKEDPVKIETKESEPAITEKEPEQPKLVIDEVIMPGSVAVEPLKKEKTPSKRVQKRAAAKKAAAKKKK